MMRTVVMVVCAVWLAGCSQKQMMSSVDDPGSDGVVTAADYEKGAVAESTESGWLLQDVPSDRTMEELMEAIIIQSTEQ